ncbi:LamG-like jellyroll fold domain-containing protein [Agarilytica rhodophyticola]|uniref:LamG-like jellyroll fold domain-containing protein n=1 Tax=Agarilytica rhodophyticola TaxID=1737490 RepID=UPI000B343F88|nr:LamG-like jellyroll fold domain-containing protein [Agarilytica rhodophyticola]
MSCKKKFLFGVLFSIAGSKALALPEAPAFVRDVHMSENKKYTRPTLPPTQTSADGRVALSHKSATFFRLHVPEKLNTPFVRSPAGTYIYSSPDAMPDPTTRAPIPSQNRNGHVALCDPSFDPQSDVKNPRVCGNDDCYDMYVVSFRKDQQRGKETKRLVSTEVTVRVANPKTRNAKIVDVDLGNVVISPTHLPIDDTFFEPMVVGEGRLLVGRTGAGGTFMPWTNSKGVTKTSFTNVVYMTNDRPDNFKACDVRQWNKVFPLSHAPYDNTINQRYGFAMQKFKDTAGKVIKEDTTFWGSYPWMDKDADNISLTTFDDSLLDRRTFTSEYDFRCPRGVTCSSDSEVDSFGNQGRVIMGLWTRGKMVHLDGILNHVNYSINSEDHNHREVRYYDRANDHNGYIRVGNGRENQIALMPLGSSGNTDFLDSNEHRFNYLENMRPVTPRDVVWTMSTGSATAEVHFDDYLNVNTFINANMNNMIEVLPDSERFYTRGVKRHDDRIQNASTSPLWNVPRYGRVLGNGRIEETANGGIEGRGFWLDGEGSAIEFDVPRQSRNISNKSWYYSVFVDVRNTGNNDKTLISFPDGSKVKLRGTNYLRYYDTIGDLIANIDISQGVRRNRWAHIGIQRLPNNNKIKTFINGMHIHNYSHHEEVFQMVPGKLTLGMNPEDDNENFRGWIDDFKVFSENINREVACNHANGTLVGVNGRLGKWWQGIADRTPEWVNNEISNHLRRVNAPDYPQYFCFHNYSGDNKADLGNVPVGAVSVRDDFVFPEGPIKRNAPRPESRNNAFCLTCHTSDGKEGLSLQALALRPGVNAINDPRRQPMQPDPRIFGNIPENWLGNDLPARRIYADPISGYPIDRLVLPKN